MFKNRRFLSGLGVGLIAGSLMIQSMTMALNAGQPVFANHPSEVSGSVYDASSRLEDNDHEQTYTQEELDQAVAEAQKQADHAKAEEEVKTTIRAFYIEPGMNSDEVANLLFEMKLIRDIGAFKQILDQNNLDAKIQLGLYQFTGNPSIDQIINTITKQ